MITELFDLSGRTALITGGGTGLGRQFAKILAEAGATVVLCARRVDKLQATAAEIQQSGGQALCFAMDVTDADSISSAFDQIGKQVPVSILINNAGMAAEPMLLDVSEEEWDQVQDTNLKGAWLVAKEAAKRMIDQGVGGSIVNIASALGIAVQKGTGPYSASKAGLLHLTRNMAVEWSRYGIRVNAIAPGYYATDIADEFLNSERGQAMIKRIPQRRLGDVEDLSGAILLLSSDAGAYMTGSVVTVDGGHSLPTI
ncbi:MAG: SDR family NAD(P)-dependent oxidoreductase [Pseudomonadales bacterium]